MGFVVIRARYTAENRQQGEPWGRVAFLQRFIVIVVKKQRF
jgi:hypothetical protein